MTRRTVHRPRDLSAKALPPPHRSLRSHRGELAGPLSRDDVHAAGAQCSRSARHRCGRSPLVPYAPLGTYSMAPPTTTGSPHPSSSPARLPLVCFVLVLCSSSHVVLMKHQLALTASLREQKRARREG
eukprot:CAMPEP_0119483714 /NCGR_PEP_ID=MMETSP1344-20130328/10996_1 /TAXON_ID=236787 /ORGANISM="Florenciella parvula, Strain CCMP2471" /LENGTH=127 /DNA_ID=CAMNT_0007518225 /DNA_START=11 /DNA_END=391 /DNA_ORIENTATION=+